MNPDRSAPAYPGALLAHVVTGDVDSAARELSQISPSASLLQRCLVLAAANGQLDVLKMLEQRGADLHACGQEALGLAAAAGWSAVIEHLVRQGVELAPAADELVIAAARNGHVEALKVLHRSGCSLEPCTQLQNELAARPARSAVLEYLGEKGALPTARNLARILRAIRSAHLPTVRTVFEYIDVDAAAPALLDAAARTGSIEVLRFLDESGASIIRHGGHALLAAAETGHYRVVRHVLTHGFSDPQAVADALRLAAENGHTAVLDYLYKSGHGLAHITAATLGFAAFNGHERAFDFLTDAGRDGIADERPAIEAMQAEIAAADPVYRPSRLWEFFNQINLEQLRRFGMQRFKRCVNQNYFNYVPLGVNDQQLRGLLREWLRKPTPAPLSIGIADPDRYAGSGRRVGMDRRVFQLWATHPALAGAGRWLQRQIYRVLVGLLWSLASRNDPLGLAQGAREPLQGAPIETWQGDRLVSQDLAHSLLECNAMLDGWGRTAEAAPMRVAEVGPGYGRVGDVLLRANHCRYFVFDIPPSLFVAQWYLSRRYPRMRIFAFRHIERFEDVREELESADIAFFTANQIALFPEGYFDLGVNISSLHEMRPEQMRHMLGELFRISARRVYLKQYRHYVNPWDGIEVAETDYPVAPGWRKRYWRPDRIDARFFEAVLEKEAPPAQGAAPAPAAPANAPSIAILLANYDNAHFLRSSLEAILAQTDAADELVVVDDGSVDGSIAVIESMIGRHPRSRLLRHGRNRGQHAAIQRALLAASADYVVWASADDLLGDRFIERTRQALAAHPGVGLCFSRLCAWREGTFHVTEFSEKNHGAAFDLGTELRHYSPAELREILRRHYLWISGNTIAARRDVLVDMGGFDAGLRWHADWFTFYAIALRHGAVGIPETLAMMRERAETYSRTGMQDARQQGKVLRAILDTFSQPRHRDLHAILRECPSLLSPFGRAVVRANLWRVQHWDVLLPLLAWQWRRRFGSA